MAGRKAHSAARRNEWLGIIHIAPEVVQLLAPGEHDRAIIKAQVNPMLRPVFDSHYEAEWPNAGAVPYTSVYATRINGNGPLVNIEMRTWPGERTEVLAGSQSPAERAQKVAGGQVVTPPRAQR